MAQTKSNLRRQAAWILDVFNFAIPIRLQLFEFCDLQFVPFLIKQCAQNTLEKHWTQRIPILQSRAPAELAADVIDEVFRAIETDDGNHDRWKVVDFCSGSGGPTPSIERRLQAQRRKTGREPIPFYLSDITPNLDAYVLHASRSENLSFIPDPVDATNPPFAAISSSTPGDKAAAREQGYEHDGCKVMRLFSLAFHHFDDEGARRVIKSTMDTSDAVVIFELQERRIGSLILMMLEPLLVYIMAIFWFGDDWFYLAVTYLVPVLPLLHGFDGLISCLRTRTFEEFVELLDRALGKKYEKQASGPLASVQRGDWVFATCRTLHTWPLGYMNVIVGSKVRPQQVRQLVWNMQ